MPTIGEHFKEARTRKGISEETAAKVLKIKLERLQDLESDRFDHFAASIYARSFIRHYSAYLGIDSAPLLELYGQTNPEPERKPLYEGSDASGVRIILRPDTYHPGNGFALTSTGQLALAFILILVVAGGGGYWLMNRTPRVQTPIAPPFSTDTSSTLPPETTETPPPTDPLQLDLNIQPVIPPPETTAVPAATNNVDHAVEPENWKIHAPELNTSLSFPTNANHGAPASLPGKAVTLP